MSDGSQASGSSPLKRKRSDDGLLSSSPTRRQKVHGEQPRSISMPNCLESTGEGLPPVPQSAEEPLASSALVSADVEKSKPVSERTDRDTSCWQHWEGSFEDVSDAAKMLQDIEANVEIRRNLKRGTAKVAEYAAEAAILANGEGLKHRRQQLEEIPSSRELHDDREIDRLEYEIRDIEVLIRSKQDQQNDATIRLNNEANALTRHVRAVYRLVEGLNIKRFAVFRGFPAKFFADFAACQDLDLQLQEIEEELKASRLEVDARQDQIHQMVVQVIQARNSELSEEAERALSALEDELEELKAAPDLLDLERSCDNLAEELDAVEKKLSAIEVIFYDTIEEHLVAEGRLEAFVISDPVDADAIEGGRREQFSTPLEERDAKPFDQDHMSRQVDRRLQNVLRQRYKAAAREVEACRLHLEALRLMSDLTPEERASAESVDHAFFLAKSRRTRALVEAEEACLDILSSAQEAGVSGIPAKSVGFSSHASDGYTSGTIELYVGRTDLDCVQQWVDNEESAKSKVDYADGKIVQMDGPDEPGNAERPVLQSLDVGESYSTIATGKDKDRIDGWLAVQKPRVVSRKSTPSSRRMSI
ncbi:hypothetical protein CLAFUW4_13526 [Fulvia fulva]|uniref:Uncharacterized protein n=1 Tax=Passalora fulva TaxID=5499 RepID=A0A9Q8UVT8_PASFU|nr:uncharacterized protein CLAFUR5_13377 [Fulvia fulva]KAK4610679.1 hypothetical protein CLAFUR4_13528 [Fulvia fulva]KAK4611005.1 hypothetical protein CLAFUR0_13537 [Fulvia fulva]UJO24308.1 hypothetical protein CLAFUR5_13377 [Fulvia fulva]WPV22123.1 hypothetical protein CLAFUW4_13526 [Fulvia fulva]WPV37204.1 hypothetical protein CLAFUW7_13533 [Fulvia fulva]